MDRPGWKELASFATRPGFTLPEVLVALLLGLFLVHLGLRTLARLDRARTTIAARTDVLVALRVSRHVLRRETRHGTRGSDWKVDADSLALRAFRGVALVCGSDSVSAGLVVSYDGERAPDPSKDSVLLLTEDGQRVARALLAATTSSTPCGLLGPGTEALWRLDSLPPMQALAAKLFERGSYHLSGSALRYRRGAGGRQPLTPEVWSGESGWAPSAGRLAVTLVPTDPSAGAPWTGIVAAR
jgi:prepilin-type N-terminal cleavage/methylation domain-containing protein